MTAIVKSISTEGLRRALASGQAPTILDVRRAAAFAENPQTIPGALRRLPEDVMTWANELARDGVVVAYCVHGHQVSQGVVDTLASSGVQAFYLDGGIEQWKAEGGPVDAASV